MKYKSIQLKELTWKRLAQMRIDCNKKTFNDVIKMLMENMHQDKPTEVKEV